jgi:hypothetical protein
MRDIDALKNTAIDAISTAVSYLGVRSYGATTEPERNAILSWMNQLQSLVPIIASADLDESGDEQQDQAVRTVLDAIRARIGQFQEVDDFTVVTQTLFNLLNTARYITGPSGPGAGNPSGWPGRGKP